MQGVLSHAARTAALLLLGAVASAAELMDAPLPSDVVVSEPAPDVPASLRPFAGKWSGDIFMFANHQKHFLIVERLEPNVAWVVWSLGLNNYAGGSPEWYRIPAIVRGDVLRVFVNGAEITYKLVSHDEIELEGWRSGYRMSGKLKREQVPIAARALTEQATYWPLGIEKWEPGETTSSNLASFRDYRDSPIQPATPDLPAERAKWLGRWSGWACRERSCDAKLVVLSVTDRTARVVQLFAGEGIEPNYAVREAKFLGDELILRAGRLRVSYRMRPSGAVEFLRIAPNGTYAAGVLTKTQ